jgi:hypothetical protein
MAKLQEMAEAAGGTDPHIWLTGALKLRVLLQKDQEELVDMERKVQELKASYLLKEESAASAKIKTETSDIWVETKKKEVFIKTALDTILLSKKFAQTEIDIYRAQ